MSLELKRLDINDLDNMISLQKKVISNLHPCEQHFIVHRTKSDFAKALNSNDTIVFGMYNKNKLISHAMLTLPDDNEPRDMEYFAREHKNSELAIYKAILVDPDYRGCGIMEQMLKIREKTAKQNGRRIAISLIAADNPRSWINALKNGMHIAKTGTNPRNGENALYLKKYFNSAQSPKLSSITTKMHLPEKAIKYSSIIFNKMQNLSDSGFIATSWDKANNSIVWSLTSSQRAKIRSYPTYQMQAYKKIIESSNA